MIKKLFNSLNMISHLGLYIYIFVSTSKSLYFCKCSMYKLPTNEFYCVILLFEVKKKLPKQF